MSESLDRLFAQLQGQPPPAPFAPAEAVRRRGRRRTFHQAIAAGVAVLAVTVLGAGSVAAALQTPDAPHPPPRPPAATSATSPTPPGPETGIPADWLLAAADLGGSGWRHDPGELVEGPWYWGGGWCPEYRVEDYRSITERTDLEITGFSLGSARVDQVVELFAPGAAARNIDDVRAYLDLCSRRMSPDGAEAGSVYEIMATGFAGDRSLLVQVDEYQFDGTDQIVPAGTAHEVAVVQVGDAVTTIRFHDHSDVYGVAERAGARLAR